MISNTPSHPLGMTIKEVAERLGLHVQTIKRYIADGTIQATKIGNKWRITEAAVQEYLDKRSNIPSEANKKLPSRAA